jgi:uncharacterized protein (TIGR02246 family)
VDRERPADALCRWPVCANEPESIRFMLAEAESNREENKAMSMEKQNSDTVLINELLGEYIAAINAGDMDRWMEVWSPEGKQMPPGAPARVGLEEIREGNRPMFDLFNTEMTVYPDELRILGDHAYGHGNYDYAMTPKEGGQSISGRGKFLSILEKQKDGSWKFAIDCFNDNAPAGAD